jgi:tartrate-resistant acid phosphatase type 5
MTPATRTLIVLILGVIVTVRPLAGQQKASPPLLPLTDSVLAKLPPDWRDMALHIKASEQEQQRYLKLSDVVLRQTVARLLTRTHSADSFIKTQLTADPAPAVRTAIVQAMAADSRWNALPETPALIEGVVARDPDVAVSLTALETLRRWRTRELSALLGERLAAATKRGDDAASMARLVDAQERWISLERGTMLPAFMRTPPPVFSVKAADTPVRVLAFGDFGNGSVEQKTVAQTINTYHRGRALDLAITLGDNFYSVGMESPADPRWQTWFEDLYGQLGITFFAALGNHDWGHPDSPAAEVLYSGRTPTWRMPAAYYTFTAGPVQFFALDTQSVALAQKQREWLDRELGKSQARWKVVYGHHPIYSVGNYEDRPDLIASVLPILVDRADVYIAGHDHNLQVLPTQRGVHFFIAGGGGAGLYEVKPDEKTIFASRANGFAVLEADASRLTVRLVDTTGQAVYEEVITKAATTNPAGQAGRR